MGTLGDAHKKLQGKLVLSQPGGLREFVYPAVKVSRTEVGNDGSTEKCTGGKQPSVSFCLMRAGIVAEEKGSQIKMVSLVIRSSQQRGWGGPGPSNGTGLGSSSVGRERCPGSVGWFPTAPSVLEIPLCPGPVEHLECPRARAETPQLEWIGQKLNNTRLNWLSCAFWHWPDDDFQYRHITAKRIFVFL